MSSEKSVSAASLSAAAESEEWLEIAEALDVVTQGLGAASELALTGFDPSHDLEKRTRRWSHVLVDHSARSLALYAAGLARAESDAWARDEPIIATQALSDRRFLFGDRLVHWVVPWLLPVARGGEALAQTASSIVDRLLALGDRHRPAPALTGSEGLFPPGHDSIGVLTDVVDVTSLLSGWVFRHEPSSDPAPMYGAAVQIWRALAVDHAGTSQLWLDLSMRARRSAGIIDPDGSLN